MPTKEQLLNEYLLAAMDSGKVRMKSPKAGKGGEALMTAAENVLPFVSAAKSALEGDYRNAMIQAGLDVALPHAVQGAAALGGKFLAPVLAGAIKAYHGSPHKFDKFDISKIGSGEGAQAFGHGLYFAESPKVADEYAEKLGAAPVNIAIATKLHGKNPKTILEQMYPNRDESWYKNVIKMAESGEPLKESRHLYETNLRWPDAAREAADPLSPHHFLDWDKPLSEQSPKVLSALENAGYKLGASEREIEKYADDMLKSDAMNWADETGGDWVDFSNNADWDGYVDAAREQLGGVNPKTTGERFYQDLVKDFGYNPRLFEKPTEYSESVAGHLHELGIPGIRYLDGGSRSAGEGTHNYVLFSDELAEILKRNDEQLKASKVVAPRDEALRIAQENAVKMLGLPPGNTPMDRAQALGYVEDAYHGAPLGFQGSSVEFPKGANRTSKKLQGFYGSTHPERASLYAENADGAFDASAEVLPLRMKMGKSFDLQGDRMLTQNEKDALFKMIEPLGPSGWAKGKMDNAHTQSDMFRIMTYAGVPDAQQREVLMQLGYTTAKDGHELITLNPANVRSRFAAFDPSRIDENDLLAGLAALGIGLPALSLSTDKDYD
jgi:hypothetical protein